MCYVTCLLLLFFIFYFYIFVYHLCLLRPWEKWIDWVVKQYCWFWYLNSCCGSLSNFAKAFAFRSHYLYAYLKHLLYFFRQLSMRMLLEMSLPWGYKFNSSRYHSASTFCYIQVYNMCVDLFTYLKICHWRFMN